MEGCGEMARLATMAASSHHPPCRCPPPPPPQQDTRSPSAIASVAAWMCPNAAATNWDRHRHVLSSSSPPRSVVGDVWRKRPRLASTPGPSLHLRQLSSSCRNLWGGNRNGGLGLPWRRRRTGSVCCGGTGRGAQVDRVEQDEDPRLLALEAELYDFMRKSSKPSHFPTKDELVAAGRMDLVGAIAEHGGWLAYSCDFDDDNDDAAGSTDDAYDDDGDDVDGDGCGGKGGQLQGGEWRAVAGEQHDIVAGRQDNENFQQQRQVDVGEESGIRGILNRLEKERSFSYLEVDNRISSKNKIYDSGAAANEAGSFGNKYGVDNIWSDIHMDDPPKRRVGDMKSGSNEPKRSAGADQKSVLSHLQFLESELDSVLSAFRFRTDEVVSYKGQEASLKDVDKLSDALEFQETEIMSAQDKLRSIRAKLAAFEGKMVLHTVEALKIMEEKQKRIDAAQKALCLLRTICIVWPNSASEVFLAGSFDGWTSQIQMERTSTGIFSLYLKLYPGHYEIKFIVDGVWKIDPLRPTLYNNGYENNLLIIQ